MFAKERIVTTVAKAKAVRPFVERLITLARKGTLHARRLVISRLGPSAQTQVQPGDPDDAQTDTRTVVKKLFEEIGPRFKERPGGYTRIVKRHERRLGDGGPTAYLELLKEGETKVRLHERREPTTPKVESEEPAAQEHPGTQEQPVQQTGGEQATAPQPPSPGGEAQATGGQEPPKS